MRINIYNEEITGEVEVVETVAKKTGITYFGTRMFLKSPDDLHYTPDDDDRSAITIWVGDKLEAERLARTMRFHLSGVHGDS